MANEDKLLSLAHLPTIKEEILNQSFEEVSTTKADSIIPTLEGTIVNLTDSGEYPIQNLTLYGKSIQDGTPTPDSPIDIQSIGDSGNVDVKLIGKNLLDMSNARTSTSTLGGITVTYIGDNTYSFVGTAESWSVNYWFRGGYTHTTPLFYLEAGVTYTVVDCALTEETTQIIASTVKNRVATITPSTRRKVTGVRGFGTSPDAAVDITDCRPRIFVGSVDLGYEPYKSQSASIDITEPLRGIPVKSGGNVTIDGQQYVADTLTINADGSGEIVRRCGLYILDGAQNKYSPIYGYWSSPPNTVKSFRFNQNQVIKGSPIISNKLANLRTWNEERECACATETAIDANLSNERLGVTVDSTGVESVDALIAYTSENPIDFIYCRLNPTTEQLTSSQVQAFLTLHTYKPISNIYNTDGAFIEATYIADTKLYIDNKFNALTSAILAQGGNV